MVIYKITNKVNGKIYIGQTTGCVKKRWKQHTNEHSCCRRLKNAINKYGPDKFNIEIIDRASNIDDLNKKEEYWISTFNTTSSRGYNLTKGGYNKKPSKETIIKRSISMKGKNTYKKTKAHRDKISQSRKGIKIPIFSEKKRINKLKETICKQIVNTTNGKVYKSITEAAKSIGAHPSNISICLKSKNKSCKGFYFEYLSKWNGEIRNTTSPGRGAYQSKKIIEVNSGKIFNSYSDAANKLKLNKDSLRVRMKLGKSIKGYLFEYV